MTDMVQKVFFPIILFFMVSTSFAQQPLSTVKNWGYQLQGKDGRKLKISDLKQLPFQLLVMDYSSVGEENSEFRAIDIASLQQTGKIVLSYMSIGEAEKVRFYYKRLEKNLIHQENPQWQGNYKVLFWEPAWKKYIIGSYKGSVKSYVDRILDQGFDGVYLDIIDAYEYFGSEEIGGNNARPSAALDMISFVEEISAYAKKTRGRKNFLIFVQNGSGIIDSNSYPTDIRKNKILVKTWQERYFKAIDAIGQEDVFFYGKRQNNNPYNPQVETLRYLAKFKKQGKPVFCIEYVQDKKLLDLYFRVSREKGFIPLAAQRSLDGSFLQGPLP